MQLRFIVFVGIVVTACLGGCTQYKTVDVFVVGLQSAEGSSLEQRIRVDLRIQNPNDVPISARGMQIRLDVNGARLARGVSDAAFMIPRLGETTTSIVATTSLFDLAKQLIALSGTESFRYVLEGDVFVEGGGMLGSLGRSVKFRSEGEFKPGASVNQKSPAALP
jgi:LEA14-like dessication related protein